MSYPNFPITTKSRRTRRSGIVAERSEGGKLRKRVLYATDQFDFEVFHYLSDAQKAELEAFYESNKKTAFNFTWIDGQTYVVQFLAEPRYTQVGEEEPLWEAAVRLGTV